MASGPNNQPDAVEGRNTWGSALTIVVGTTKEEFVVHKNVFSTSPFFQNAMKPEWASQRSDPDRIELPHVEPAVFQLYVHWLYYKWAPPPNLSMNGATKEEIGRKWHTYLAKAYVLGEEFLDVQLKNAVIRGMVTIGDRFRWWVPRVTSEAVTILYEGTPASSPARKLIIDTVACGADSTDAWTDEFKGCPQEFLVDAMKRTLEVRSRKPGYQWDPLIEKYLQKEQ